MRHDQPRFKGLTTAEGQIDAFNTRIINLGQPVADNDAARLQDVPGEFYATVKQTDGLASFSGIKVWSYNAGDFYISQNFPNTDEFVLSLRNPGNEITIEDTVPEKRFKNDTIIVNREHFYLTADSTGKPILNSTFTDPAVVALPTHFVDGARLRFVSIDEVSAGTTGELSRVRSESDNFNIEWFGLINADITVTGAGGRDTGPEPNNAFLAVYAIADSTGVNAVSALISLNFGTPLLPAGYDQFRRIASVRNGGAVAPFDEFLDFEQRGKGREKWTFYKVGIFAPLLLFNGTATTLTELDASTLVPAGATLMQIRVDIDANGNEAASAFITQLGGAGDLGIDYEPTSTLSVKVIYGTTYIAIQDDRKVSYVLDASGTTIADFRILGWLETV